MTAIDAAAKSDRVTTRVLDVAERLSELQSQTAALLEQAGAVTRHARELKQQRVTGICTHAAEAAELRAGLQTVVGELEGLREAMKTRGVIEQAKGMVMMRQRCDEDTAFQTLVRLSQRSHRKLVDVARVMVLSWSGP